MLPIARRIMNLMIAIALVPAIKIAASGVKSPKVNKIPPINSAKPAKSAIVTPGFMPIDSNHPPAPFNP